MKRIISFLTLAMLCAAYVAAQVTEPTLVTKMYVTAGDKVDEEATEFSGNAPMTARFEAEVDNPDGLEINYEWRLTRQSTRELVFSRAEQSTEFTFVQSGTFLMELRWSYRLNGDLIEGESPASFVVTINESRMEVPNAFTPNDDGKNEIFRVKEGYQSIVEFHAAVFNRQGKKMYSWDDISKGWDGTCNGRECPDGAYYLVIDARGADGRKYKIRKTINLLRTYDSTASSLR